MYVYVLANAQSCAMLHAFSKESWVVVDGVLMKQNKLEIRVKIDWIFVSVLQS